VRRALRVAIVSTAMKLIDAWRHSAGQIFNTQIATTLIGCLHAMGTTHYRRRAFSE